MRFELELDPLQDPELLEHKQRLVSKYSLVLSFELCDNESTPTALLDMSRFCTAMDIELYFIEESLASGTFVFHSPRNVMHSLRFVQESLQKRLVGASEQDQHVAIHHLAHLARLCDDFSAPSRCPAIADAREPSEELTQWVIAHEGAASLLVPAVFAGTGRGLAAIADVPPGHRVLELPKSLLITHAAVKDDAHLVDAFSHIDGIDEETQFLLFCIRHHHLSSSPWAPYFRCLPPSFTTIINFTAEQLDLLRGSPLYDEGVRATQQLQHLYEALFPALSDAFPAIFPADVFTWTHFVWARSLLDSRALEVTMDGEQVTCLIPFLDYLNHHPHAHISRRGFDEENQKFFAYSFSSCPAGCQVFMNYGHLQNGTLLQYYGFVDETNPYDNVPLGLTLADDDSLGHTKRQLMHAYGLPTDHFIIEGPLCSKLLATVRIMTMDQIECVSVLAAVQAGSPIDLRSTLFSRSNETQVLAMLVDTFEALLSGYDTTVEEDDALLSSGSLDEISRMAVVYRRSQKRILGSALRQISLLQVKLST